MRLSQDKCLRENKNLALPYLHGPRLKFQAALQCGTCKRCCGPRCTCNSIAFIIRWGIYQGPHDIRSMPGSRAAKAEMPAAKAKVSTKPPALSAGRVCGWKLKSRVKDWKKYTRLQPATPYLSACYAWKLQI